jgi:hypothetical protein
MRTDTDNLWTKIESLQWVLYVIFAIKNVRHSLLHGDLYVVCLPNMNYEN